VRSDDTVRREPGPPLEPAHCGCGPRAESPIEATGPRAVPLEQELEHADVVAAHASPHDAAAEERSPWSSECGSRPRPGEAVDSEPVPPLEDTDGAHGLGPLDGVDRPAVEAVLSERDLEPGDLWVERASSGRECEGGESGRDCEQ
jgi:hypothetical protein